MVRVLPYLRARGGDIQRGLEARRLSPDVGVVVERVVVTGDGGENAAMPAMSAPAIGERAVVVVGGNDGVEGWDRSERADVGR